LQTSQKKKSKLKKAEQNKAEHYIAKKREEKWKMIGKYFFNYTTTRVISGFMPLRKSTYFHMLNTIFLGVKMSSCCHKS